MTSHTVITRIGPRQGTVINFPVVPYGITSLWYLHKNGFIEIFAWKEEPLNFSVQNKIIQHLKESMNSVFRFLIHGSLRLFNHLKCCSIGSSSSCNHLYRLESTKMVCKTFNTYLVNSSGKSLLKSSFFVFHITDAYRSVHRHADIMYIHMIIFLCHEYATQSARQ